MVARDIDVFNAEKNSVSEMIFENTTLNAFKADTSWK